MSIVGIFVLLFMKILFTIPVLLFLTITQSAIAQPGADSVSKPVWTANDSLNIAAVNDAQVNIAGGIGQQSFEGGSLRTADNVQSSPLITPTGTTQELLAREDSLKAAITLQAKEDSTKADQYTQIAAQYLRYDSISNKKERLHYQTEAILNTLKAIHYYSKAGDNNGLRYSFDNLAKVYRSEKKYSQAKWFILQSNTLSRYKNDVPNIISSLLVLATIKTDIKDYKLAMRDLNEAMKLADSSHTPKASATVQLGYVMLYNNMKNYAKADLALKRYNFINDSISRGETAKLANTADSLQRKKKPFLTNSKRLSKGSSSKKTALL